MTQNEEEKRFHEALRKLLVSYYDFSEREIGETAKEFSEHHTACKVAITHIEQLLKLGNSIIVGSSQPDETKRIIAEAVQEVIKYCRSSDCSETNLADTTPSL